MPLRTEGRRQLYKSVLKGLCCCPCSEERDDTAACVKQVQLAVYASASESTAHVRALCAEHLFSLMSSVCDVGSSFGTKMESLCEMLVCRRQGNLLDNPLLPLLLPGMSIDCLTILTCIYAQIKYASCSCIDACCFECRRERRRRAAAASPVSRVPTGHAASRGRAARGMHAQDSAPPLCRPMPTSALFQRMKAELLMSVAQSASYALWQTPLLQEPSAALPSPSRVSNSDRWTPSETLVDRLHAVRHVGQSPAGGPRLLRAGTTLTSPPPTMTRTAPAPSAKSDTSALRIAVEAPATAPPAEALSENDRNSQERERRLRLSQGNGRLRRQGRQGKGCLLVSNRRVCACWGP
ncbi:hypothetical protein LSCM4_03412 [Leishmania orientalis]|uniref:Uncharacterized protein n=1 Tax=Leishmania orientalis TaxID=2249476 RepID=A0A836GE62_9TRYP|nr:hypothetical protein LSCM4_03412 [Leishmania orientalis]